MPVYGCGSDEEANFVTVLELKLLVILCGIATIAVGSYAATAATHRIAMAAGFLASIVVARQGLVLTPSAAATLIAITSALLLLRPQSGRTIAPVAVGAIAAQWAAALTAVGLPSPAAGSLAAGALAGVTILKANDDRFAPLVIQEEALLLVGGLAGLLATGPGIMRGWQSAVALRAIPLTETSASAAPWPFAVVGVALALGSVYAAWRHRRGN